MQREWRELEVVMTEPFGDSAAPSLRTWDWVGDKAQVSVCPAFMPRKCRATMSCMYDEHAGEEDGKDMTAWSGTDVVAI